MSGRFAGKVALVTGAGSGIGRAVAGAFAAEGAAVVLAGRDPDRLAGTERAIRDRGGVVLAVPTDITDPAAVAALFGRIEAGHGRLDVAVNNAGVKEVSLVGDTDEASWLRVVGTNLTGTWRCLRAEVDAMRGHGGVIVNVASTVGRHSTLPGFGAYAATKAGVEALSRTAAREYIGQGIRINSVSPGPFDTDMSLAPGETAEQRAERFGAALPIGRIGTPDEAARTILWVCSEDASFFVGHDFVVDGGSVL
ncbi:SDR family NAD(P)-dependent oxidoreductase [Actinosynnema sp. CS-041913]|uniref:SDR family NAD(P)-dependent oxidoreductase n=1 Tax=Actinosynnema sp. CS-041913 TaxID=3239917 RepID=UPI003D8B8E16